MFTKNLNIKIKQRIDKKKKKKTFIILVLTVILKSLKQLMKKN